MSDLQKRIVTVVTTLDFNRAGYRAFAAWIVGAFAALNEARRLRFQDGAFFQAGRTTQIETLIRVCTNGISAIDSRADATDLETLWLRGFYFNDALLRISALLERGLATCLVHSKQQSIRDAVRPNKRTPPVPHLLKLWDTSFGSAAFDNALRVHAQVNQLKHDRQLERVEVDLACATAALSEVVSLFEHLIDIHERRGSTD